MEGRNRGGGVAKRGSLSVVISENFFDGPKEKWCWRCRRWLYAELDFYRDISRSDGFEDLCKECSKRYRNEKKWKKLAAHNEPNMSHKKDCGE